MRIDTQKSIANQKLVIIKSLTSKSLDFFMLALVFGIFITFNFFIWYLIIWKDLGVSFSIISIISLTFLYWLAFGIKNKGKLYQIENVRLDILQDWIDKKINSGEFERNLNNEISNGTSLRMNGLSFSTYARDLIILFDNGSVFLSSVAIGRMGEISSTHYFADKKINKDLVQEIREKTAYNKSYI